MSDAFDGTGKGFREPSLRAPLIMLLLLVVVVAGLLLFASGALRDAGIDLPGTQVTESAPPET
jgi:hypothetical protein